VHRGHKAREAKNGKPARAYKAPDPWTYFPVQTSVDEARKTAQRFHENCEYIITNFGIVVEHRKRTKATPIGKKVVMNGSVAGMKGIRFEDSTGTYSRGLELPPVVVMDEYLKNGRVERREILAPDNHTIVRVKGKAKRVRKSAPSHKWEKRASKVPKTSSM
jgi:hypothetical protein